MKSSHLMTGVNLISKINFLRKQAFYDIKIYMNELRSKGSLSITSFVFKKYFTFICNFLKDLASRKIILLSPSKYI